MNFIASIKSIIPKNTINFIIVLMLVSACTFTMINIFNGRYFDAISLAGLIVFLVVARHALKYKKTQGIKYFIHLCLLLFLIYQVFLLDKYRFEVNMGIVWFLAIPYLTMFISNKKLMLFWILACLSAILFTAWRVPEDNVLWQHSMTLPNLLGVFFGATCVAFGFISIRDSRENKLKKSLESSEKLSLSNQKAKETLLLEKIQKEHFISNVSHELRTPLTSIMMTSSLLEEMRWTRTKKNYCKP